MATFTVDVPDDQVQLIGEAFAQQLGMPPTLDEQGQPVEQTGQALVEAQIEFARQSCITYITTIVRQHLQWKQAQQVPDVPLNLT